MSFPSAIEYLKTEHGVTPETATDRQANAALLHAMQKDTDQGFALLQALAVAQTERMQPDIVLGFVRGRLHEDHQAAVLLFEELQTGGVAIHVDPLTDLGRQVTRMVGTDAARPLLEGHFGKCISFANCCIVPMGDTPEQVAFTAKDQVRWQRTIHC